MRDRMKRVLVQSYVGAIALGYVFAEAIFAFANIFASPVENWIEQKDYQQLTRTPFPSTVLQFHDALPHLIRCVLYLLFGYALLRWLYFEPISQEAAEAAPTAERTL